MQFSVNANVSRTGAASPGDPLPNGTSYPGNTNRVLYTLARCALFFLGLLRGMWLGQGSSEDFPLVQRVGPETYISTIFLLRLVDHISEGTAGHLFTVP